MKVFISWSGDKSKSVAHSLREWLPMVVQSVEPWLSDRDLRPGSHWPSILSDQLSQSEIGLVCLTSDNTDSPWLLFESGAVARSGKLVPVLFDIESSELRGPLAHFQCAAADIDGVRNLVETLFQQITVALTEAQRETLFKVMWPLLENKFSAIREAFKSPALPEQEFQREMLAGNIEEKLHIDFSARRSALTEGPGVITPEGLRALAILKAQRANLRAELEYLREMERKLRDQKFSISLDDQAIRPKKNELSELDALIHALDPSKTDGVEDYGIY